MSDWLHSVAALTQEMFGWPTQSVWIWWWHSEEIIAHIQNRNPAVLPWGSASLLYSRYRVCLRAIGTWRWPPISI